MATTPNRSWPTPDDTDLVRDGAAAIRALGNAIDGTVGQGFVYAGTRYYTSSGQFEKADPLGTGDIGLRAVRVVCIGAGGGGGGAGTTGSNQVTNSAPGAGGNYAESFLLATAFGATVTVTRGAGGSGGSAGANAGGNGGQSSFGSLVVASGGSGGTGGGAFAVPVAPNPTFASETTTGDIGARGESVMNPIITTAGINMTVGGGAAAFIGGRGRGPAVTFTGFNGLSGLSIGEGGQNGANAQSQGTNRSGGAGGNGIVIVDCFV